MASFRALQAVSEAVVNLLSGSYQPEDFNNQLQFPIYTADNFLQPITNGVSLFLYRVLPSGVRRIPPGRIGAGGVREATRLPLEMHFLLTIWAKEPSLQHSLTGWTMRVLEDSPLLPAGVLNALAPQVFRSDEAVEIGLAELRTEDLLRLWETLGANRYQLSIPYYARIIDIEPIRPGLPPDGAPVQERVFPSGVLDPPEARP